MKRTLSYERVYQIEPYQTLRLGDSFIELPDEFVLNGEVQQTIHTIQFLSSELGYRRYLRLINEYVPDDIEEAIEVLKELHSREMKRLQELLTGTAEEESEEE